MAANLSSSSTERDAQVSGGLENAALVLIDIQNRHLAHELVPNSAADIVSRATVLIDQFRLGGGLVVFVRAGFSPDLKDVPRRLTDRGPRPHEWEPPDSFPQEFGVTTSDIVLTKRQWGAFYGTELELQLRRRGITTIALGGMATNFGVESTARQAYEMGFDIVFVQDLMASVDVEFHDFAVRRLFPVMGRVTTSELVADLLTSNPSPAGGE
jgi:nicotinamidase-related amidase